MNLDWSISDKAKPYFPASKKCYACYSSKNLLNKRNELATKFRHENKFYLVNYKYIPP